MKDITEEVYEQSFEGQIVVYQAENQENAFEAEGIAHAKAKKHRV